MAGNRAEYEDIESVGEVLTLNERLVGWFEMVA
jgi:hypothetical protein